ncbi:MAG: argininosuccinate lyase [Omnitrophica bacterium GWA2_52_8]|nr:MAG: argininosuccinate lyase [Omnitrophica bacterium GWA2_52_8]
MNKKLWGGRFEAEMHEALKKFSYSMHQDYRLFQAEIEVNRAYARMLARQGLLRRQEAQKILRGLDRILKKWSVSEVCRHGGHYEDIHAYIQSELERAAGPAAKKIHTGRSRNDLVVTSTRLALRMSLEKLALKIKDVQRSLVFLAQSNESLIFPGLTHLKKAQPVTAAHHLLAYVEMIEEDAERLQDALKRINVLPLGSAALGGSALALDRKFLASALGFSKISANSMAATSDRAFIAETLAAVSILWMHLSRLSEDFILWNSEYLNFIELDDAFASGSSLMPQKKNPDVFELVRGGAAVIFGHLVTLLTLQKGLPLCYNRDLQEDKPALFAALEKTEAALNVLAPALRGVRFHESSLALALADDAVYATDLLEYLVRKGVPFSEGHEKVGKIVRHALKNNMPLRALDLKTYRSYSSAFDRGVYKLFDPEVSVSSKKTLGSTNPSHVRAELAKWKKRLR